MSLNDIKNGHFFEITDKITELRLLQYESHVNDNMNIIYSLNTGMYYNTPVIIRPP